MTTKDQARRMAEEVDLPKAREVKHGITSTGRGIREWSQIVRFAREIEAYHGIGKDKA